MTTTFLVVLALVLLYWFPLRRWMNRWGAAPSDLARVMAGDGLLPDWTYSGTLGVVVNAPPEDIWPWLVQIGYQRGGLYSYDWLDRLFGYLDRPSATRILPEFQQLVPGDEIPLGRGPGWPVAIVEPDRALVLDMRNMGGLDWVWQFGLHPVDEHHTQLISRSRVRARTLWARLLTYMIEPAGFVMTRRMLLGIKERAELIVSKTKHTQLAEANMFSTSRTGLMTVMALILAPALSVAQGSPTHEHRGFWIGFGLGGGVNYSDGLDGERLNGGSGYLRLGGSPSQRVLLGFEGHLLFTLGLTWH